MVAYENFLVLPKGSQYGYLDTTSWSWASNASACFEDNHNFFLVCALSFYPVIFGIRHIMKDREPFDLGGAKSSARLNYIFWWELGLALFSIVGVYHVVPMAMAPLFEGKSLAESICMDGVHGDPRNVWTLLFMLSKVAEFGDTIFVVLRKKPLILLQHYHHLATMLYCWYGSQFVYNLNNTNVYFAGMNLTVHSIMYTWYAATRTGWRSPKWMMMCVTLLQLVQMVAGVSIVLVAGFGPASMKCGTWVKEGLYGFAGCLFMYFSYLVLFGQLFVSNYCTKKEKEKPN
jgi:elongation of very long chain fatty acids protein 6